jgi:peptide subunit release factor 1 (eRF1)
VAVLEKFKEELGQRDRACEGGDAVIEALSAARVDTLLVHDDPDDERLCWFSPAGGPALGAMTPEPLRSQGVGRPETARLVDVAIGLAFRTGARVRIVPSTAAAERIGAILRF